MGYTPNYLRVKTEVSNNIDLTNVLSEFKPGRVSDDTQYIEGDYR